MTRWSRPLDSRENYCYKDKISWTFKKGRKWENLFFNASSVHSDCSKKRFFGLCEGAPELYPRYDLKITIPLTKKGLFLFWTFSLLLSLSLHLWHSLEVWHAEIEYWLSLIMDGCVRQIVVFLWGDSQDYGHLARVLEIHDRMHA